MQIATLGLTRNDLTQLPPQQAQQEIDESIFRLKKLYDIETCAVAFWPWARQNKKFDYNLSLPIFSACHGANRRTEKKTSRILQPNWFTRLRLSIGR